MQRMGMGYLVLFRMEVRGSNGMLHCQGGTSHVDRFGNHWEGGYVVVVVSCDEGSWKGYCGE
eukprot:11740997-Ditylum_brightwellii.AAC.1